MLGPVSELIGERPCSVEVPTMSNCLDSQQCLDKAAEYARRADHAQDDRDRGFYLKLESAWRKVAKTRRWAEAQELT